MRFNPLIITAVLTGLLCTSVEARQTREELERAFQYGWSEEATIILFGTIAAVEYTDNEKQSSPVVNVLIRIDSLQRGTPGHSMIKVKIQNELQTYRWKEDQQFVGTTGIWFLHRVRQYPGREPAAHMIRYMDRAEMEDDPSYLGELMKYVVQGTVDKMIRPNILNLLSVSRNDEERSAVVKVDLTYNEMGILNGVKPVERSSNLMFNDHVIDTVLQVHRKIRIPGSVKETQIEIKREVL